MNILEIGNCSNSRCTRKIKYLSDSYFLDADLLIIDLEAVSGEFYELFTHSLNVGIQHRVLKHAKFVEFITHMQKRQDELTKFFKKGGNLLLFKSDDSVSKFKVEQGDTLSDSVFDFLTILELNEKKFQVKKVSGHNIKSEGFFEDFFNEYHCKYDVLYTKYEGYPIATVSRTGEPVALCVPVESGHILILPEVELRHEDGDDDEYRDEKMHDALEALDNDLRNYKASPTPVTLPDWTKSYLLGEEKNHLQLMEELRIQQTDLQLKILNQKQILAEYDQLKQLLFESGKNLESVIENVFSHLGYEILPTIANRDDLIIKHENDIAVLEIKGVNGSAGEKHALQLEKWVSEYGINHDHIPKGILIVNAFRDKPLAERTENSFPDQMMKYATGREQCLMTSTDLLELFLAFTMGKMDFLTIHNLLFQTVGTLKLEQTLIERIKQ